MDLTLWQLIAPITMAADRTIFMAVRLKGETNALNLAVPPFLRDLRTDGKSSVLVAHRQRTSEAGLN